jgi:hypothetical protein
MPLDNLCRRPGGSTAQEMYRSITLLSETAGHVKLATAPNQTRKLQRRTQKIPNHNRWKRLSYVIAANIREKGAYLWARTYLCVDLQRCCAFRGEQLARAQAYMLSMPYCTLGR